jgi:hypothetical protein
MERKIECKTIYQCDVTYGYTKCTNVKQGVRSSKLIKFHSKEQRKNIRNKVFAIIIN